MFHFSLLNWCFAFFYPFAMLHIKRAWVVQTQRDFHYAVKIINWMSHFLCLTDASPFLIHSPCYIWTFVSSYANIIFTETPIDFPCCCYCFRNQWPMEYFKFCDFSGQGINKKDENKPIRSMTFFFFLHITVFQCLFLLLLVSGLRLRKGKEIVLFERFSVHLD